MRRDIELIRQLLLKLEDQKIAPNVTRSLRPADLQIEGYDIDVIVLHLDMLTNSPYLKNSKIDTGGNLLFMGISWEGHELIDAIREKDVWKETLENARKNGSTETISFIFEIAKSVIKKQLKEKAGIEF